MHTEAGRLAETYLHEAHIEEDPRAAEEAIRSLVEIIEHEFQNRDSLGSGKAGEVWIGKNAFFGKDICIKSIHNPEASINTLELEFLLHEAFLKAGGRAPELIGYVKEVDDQGQQHEFLAMEAIDGVSLRDWMKELLASGEQVTEGDLQRLLSDIDQQIDLAHEAGIFHRDLHTGNVLRRRSDGKAVIIDFGDAGRGFRGASDRENYRAERLVNGRSEPFTFYPDERILKTLRVELIEKNLLQKEMA